MRVQAGIRSLAVSFPEEVRKNDYWHTHHAEFLKGVEKKRQEVKVWSPGAPGTADQQEQGLFEAEMAPYLGDPFRGTVERRILAPGQTTLDLELRAAADAVKAAGLSPGDIDALIGCTFVSEHVGLGHATFLAGRLGLSCAAWNMESACATPLMALQSACALVHAGQYKNVLVVVSCTYSRVVDWDDTLSFNVGDGAGAFVVSAVKGNRGLYAQRSLHTAETCGSMYFEVACRDGVPEIRMRATKQAGRRIRDISESHVRALCRGALDAAGVGLSDIDFFVFNTPVAWYSSFCAKAVGIDPKRTIDTYPRYGNVGSALLTTNLYHALHEGKIRPGALVSLFSIGTVSSASCAIVRLGEVALGPAP